MSDESVTTNGMGPCKLCGSKDVAIDFNGPTPEQVQHAISWGQDYDASYFGFCHSCSAWGLSGETGDEAKQKWNECEHAKEN